MKKATKKISHRNAENHSKGASQSPPENPKESTSPVTLENHNANASHNSSENQANDASAWMAMAQLHTRSLYDMQKLRIQHELRLKRLEREGITIEAHSEKLERSFDFLKKAEKDMEAVVWACVRDLPIVQEFLSRVRGIGPRLSGLLIANIRDVSRFETCGKLWAYAGVHTVPTCDTCDTPMEVVGQACEKPTKDFDICPGVAVFRAAKRRKGVKANWNSELKTTCYKISDSFIKSGSPYADLYRTYKARIIEREVCKGTIIWGMVNNKYVPIHSPAPSENHTTTAKPDGVPEWTMKRIDNMARRYMVKIFLSHLWEVWRELEGLEARAPYSHEYLNHSHKIEPWAFVEPANK